jgi:bifunctional enzyme CysN/CysC
MPASGRDIPVEALNERRKEAVRLRLAGATVEQAAKKTGLSAPTVIAAFKAWRAGGWAAVPVAPRGRGAASAPPARQAVAPRAPLRVVLCGDAGAGKSTLLARLQRPASARYALIEAPSRAAHARELAEAARAADAALVVVDARDGLRSAAHRHALLAALFGGGEIALAVNKMDLAGYSEARFREIEAQFRDLAARAGLAAHAVIPLSARRGANLAAAAREMRWYRGPALTGWLESLEPQAERLRREPLRFAVEGVHAPSGDAPAAAGRIASGLARVGMPVCVLPSGRASRIERILGPQGEREAAGPGEQVALALADGPGASAGDLVCAAEARAEVADQFEAALFWTGEEPLLRGRTYEVRIAARTAAATVAPLKYRLDADTLEHVAAETLESNQIGVCEIELDRPIAFDPFARNRATGGFELLDPQTGRGVGIGVLRFALRRAHNVHWQHVDVDKAARARLKRQRPCVLWLTGLSGAGKSTVANLVEKRLHAAGYHTYLLDGDNVRHGLNKDLGFTAADRVENIRRIAEVAKLMVDAGLIVITAFISPFRAERRMARALLAPGEFFEVHVDAPLELAEQRDPKGLYRKARRGEIKNFTGIDSPYEPPEQPEIHLDTARAPPEQAAEQVIAALRRAGIIAGA